MSDPATSTPPSDKNTPSQDRGIFTQEAKKHECHHYARMMGGQVLQAAAWGFGATLGADAANAAVGDVKVLSHVFGFRLTALTDQRRNGGGIESSTFSKGSRIEDVVRSRATPMERIQF